MMQQYMEELEQEPFDVTDFVERLTWRANNEVGSSQFDPEILHETFVNTIKDLKILQEKQQRKCERIEEALKEEQKVHARNITKLQDRHQTSVEWFHQLDEKINSVAGKIIHLGEQLENVNTPRSRTVEAQKLLNHMSEFLMPGPIVNDLFNDPKRIYEAADVIQKLYTISQDLPASKFEEAKKKIERKYDEIERGLIEEFATAQKSRDIERMKIIAEILLNFKGYSQCINAYIEQSQMTQYGGKDIFFGIVPMCEEHNEIIKKVFSSPDQVMAKFILNIYQLKLNDYARMKLEDKRDDEKYLRTLHEMYSRTVKLSTDLQKYMPSSDDDLLTKLTANIFAKDIVIYIETEIRCLKNKCVNELEKYYSSKKHQKKQTERFQDLKREVQASLSNRLNINIAQVEDYGGETFLSEELAINLLQQTKTSLKRTRILSKDIDLAGNVIKIADILLLYLMHEHVNYALEIGLQAIPLGESKIFPQIYFFYVIQKSNTIVHLLEKLYAASIVPCVKNSPKLADCLQKKRLVLEQIESKLDTGLDRVLNAIIGWVKVYLQTEQKKTDYKPENDVYDTLSTAACMQVVQTLQPIIKQIKKCLDGENLQSVLTEFGIRLHRVIYEHLQSLQFNVVGAMCVICDVNEYRKLARELNSPLVIQLFDTLHALCNLLLVKSENILEACTGDTLNHLDKSVIRQFIQLRGDFRSIKTTNFLKGIIE